MNPDAVYALLVDANPVPDPDELGDGSDGALDAVLREEIGQSPRGTGHRSDRTRPDRGQSVRRSRIPWMVAAAAVLVAVAVTVGLVLTGPSGGDDPVASEPEGSHQASDVDDRSPVEDPQATRTEAAVDIATTFIELVHAGDVDAVMAMSNENFGDPTQDRNFWEMNAVHAAAWPRTLDGCEVGSTFGGFVRVLCTISFSDPVWRAVGAGQIVAPYRVFDDGTVAWDAYVGHLHLLANRAYADYLAEFHPDEYEQACAPGAYSGTTVLFRGGLALTRRCAQAWVVLSDDVAEWVLWGGG